MKTNSSEDLYWIHALRVLATFSVIFIHAAYKILCQYGSISNFDWWIGNIYDGSVRFCVPMFLMISGALILSKTYNSLGEYLRKRVLKILPPLLFWSIIYIVREVLRKSYHGEYMSFIEILKFALIKLKSRASVHLGFVYMIIGLYLFFPVIGKWINKCNKHEIKYFIGIWLLTVLVQQFSFINNLFPNIGLTYFSGFIGFPVLGYYLYKNTFADIRKENLISVLMILTGVSITVFGTFVLTKRSGSFNEDLYSYLTLNVILVSTGVFLLFKNLVKFNTRTSSIILFFSKYSYGIYLIHILVLLFLAKLGFSHAFVNPIIGIPITSVLCMIVSASIVFGISKLPWGKYVSG
ncbi:MAG: acyltransferase family protein [Chitinophagaceae bacterium]|jgi:surface polysaccharide O-acyltransferase-like enzyme|nr:acyltransferase family protein [Chitinophagaceae bacterium]